MGISLGNHEDRIKRLENNTGSKSSSRMFSQIGSWNGTNPVYNPTLTCSATFCTPTDNIFELQPGTYVIDARAHGRSDSHGSESDAFCQIVLYVNDVKKYSAAKGGTAFYGYVESHLVVPLDVTSTSNVKIEAVGDGVLNRYNGMVAILKLYYNFSYNIYRLIRFISFHFFKCLINSFKGGVKEIWQLV